ncbi:hypothetical protein Z959_07960 [Clostridium novyi B str. ATCC 27606]|uniref:TraD/TraG TraM recognition site domain-containing protein n=1 Tax=Clostridium novyi B str. ATCC 27606 TaxID=1443123 RepID=A0AA40M3C6_CLONO|nr:hypothetical protein [Clostridium novyi]KEI17000.1 hypothetical protein Z959_07960 [Clostridium novyi B str. ATCC 27606]
MLFKKEKSMKVSTYFELIKPQYTYIKVIPDKSIRNYNSINIAKAISNTYRTIGKRLHKEKKKLFFETNFKIAYILDITKEDTSFYFMIPKPFVNIIIEKVREVWPKTTLVEVQEIKEHVNPITYQLSYKKEDALSIHVDKKSNEPLNSILSVLDIMKDDDRVTIIYNFIPRTKWGWLKQYNTTIDKVKSNKPVEKEKTSAKYIFKLTLSVFCEIISTLSEVISDMLGNKNENNTNLSLIETVTTVINNSKELSNTTKKKKELNILETQIAVLSDSPDKTRQENNGVSVCQAYRVLDEDNELQYKKLKKNTVKLDDYRFKGIESNVVSVDECQNFLQVPGRQLLNSFNINHIDVTETEVPQQLQKGYIELGDVKYKGNTTKSYLEDEYNIGSLPLVLNGAQGSGKSTYIANMYRFANKRKEGGVLIDYIKKNELTEEVLKYLPKEDVILLDYSKPECMQGFVFNEIEYNENMSSYDKLKLANLQSQQVLELINAVNDKTQPLAARMRKYLISAATIVFSTGESSLKEVVKCLENHVIRHEYIKKLSTEEKELLEDKIKILEEIDDYSKPTKDNPESQIIGTKDNRIDGILDRISLLKEDFDLEYMFNKGAKDNINIAKELEKGKVVIVKMLQDEFSQHAKNVITTFFISKIWLSTEIRGKWNNKPKRTYITIDEVFQTPIAMELLAKKNVLPQTRKFGCKFVFSCQITSQLDILLNTLEGAGASFMLLKGTKEEDFKKFENKIKNFEYEDVRDMQKYHSLNLIYYSSGYASFISKLPPPLTIKGAN